VAIREWIAAARSPPRSEPVIDEFDDALLQFVYGIDTDVAEDGSGCFGEKPLDEVEPGTVFGGEHKREAAVRLSG
jgi:hypothetical protein